MYINFKYLISTVLLLAISLQTTSYIQINANNMQASERIQKVNKSCCLQNQAQHKQLLKNKEH